MLKLFTSGTTTAATGKTVAITLSKAGGAFGNPNAGASNATEVSSGWYKFTLDATDTGTVGDLVVRGTATGCDDTERIFGVVKATNGGLTALPDTAVTSNASLLTSGSGTDQLLVASGKVVTPDTQKVDVNTIKTQTVTCSAGVTVSPYVGSTGAAVNGTNVNTLASHDPGATLGTSTLTQDEVTGGAYALNSASFAFNAALDFTTAQKAATLARVTLVDTATNLTNNNDKSGYALTSAYDAAKTAASASDLATVAGYLDTEVAAILEDTGTTLPAQIAALNNISAADVWAAGTRTLTANPGLDAAGVRAAVGLASANLDTQLADLPTVAEFEARTIAAANYATASTSFTAAPGATFVSAVQSGLFVKGQELRHTNQATSEYVDVIVTDSP